LDTLTCLDCYAAYSPGRGALSKVHIQFKDIPIRIMEINFDQIRPTDWNLTKVEEEKLVPHSGLLSDRGDDGLTASALEPRQSLLEVFSRAAKMKFIASYGIDSLLELALY
ncbi:hypothetical protein HAX54_039973, partial [Datura stramonium]|nr:hypothetical protein [Datura stramonium]